VSQPYPADENGSFQVKHPPSSFQDQLNQNTPYVQEAKKTSDRELLETVLTICLAYKVAFPHAAEDQQVEFLQSGYQAIMEALDEAGVDMSAQKFAAATSGIIAILGEHQ